MTDEEIQNYTFVVALGDIAPATTSDVYRVIEAQQESTPWRLRRLRPDYINLIRAFRVTDRLVDLGWIQQVGERPFQLKGETHHHPLWGLTKAGAFARWQWERGDAA